ncbi:MAG: ribonuclease III [Oscillospiraceae bacterium]|nr:ribonuclease III [Oscillospiraceae bacterium]
MNTQELQEIIGYRFCRPDLLERALSHSSWANEHKEPRGSNERLEFLGDSVLGFLAAEYLFRSYPQKPEGELTKLRAAAVCEPALSAYAKSISLGEALLLGKGEAATGGGSRPSILADAFEALLAAMYLDGGIEPARHFILGFLKEGTEHPAMVDSKTELQQIVQQTPEESVDYVLVDESGPDHNKCFVVEVRLHSNVLGVGRGHSKKVAEQEAAREALRLMGI